MGVSTSVGLTEGPQICPLRGPSIDVNTTLYRTVANNSYNQHDGRKIVREIIRGMDNANNLILA